MPSVIDEDKLVTENMGLINMAIKRYLGFGVDYEDLFQIGAVGLITGLRRKQKSKIFDLCRCKNNRRGKNISSGQRRNQSAAKRKRAEIPNRAYAYGAFAGAGTRAADFRNIAALRHSSGRYCIRTGCNTEHSLTRPAAR